MKQEIRITLLLDLTTGKVNLNEIVYRLKEIREPLMLSLLRRILTSYDDLISERLSKKHGSKDRAGLGRHKEKGKPAGRYCQGRKVLRRGYRQSSRHISTVFGMLELPLRTVSCCRCGARFSPLLGTLQIDSYARKEMNFEHAVIESVIDTNYRRLIEGRSIDISLGGIHNLVVGSDIDEKFQEKVSTAGLSAIVADSTGVKQQRGKKGELRAVIGITQGGRVKPLGCFANDSWSEIEQRVKDRIKHSDSHQLPFVYDGEPGLDDFLADIAESQRCTWHGPRGLSRSLWADGLGKKKSQADVEKIKHLVGIELPAGDFELLKEEDKQQVRDQYAQSKNEIQALIETFYAKGYRHGATYLERISGRLFTHVELWLKTGVIAPKTTSLLERVFRELGRRLKKIAWGWSDSAVTNLSKMIMIRQYSRDQWEDYWKEKLGIRGYCKIQIESVKIS